MDDTDKPENLIKKVKRLKSEGMTCIEIARETDMSLEAIDNIINIKKYGFCGNYNKKYDRKDTIDELERIVMNNKTDEEIEADKEEVEDDFRKKLNVLNQKNKLPLFDSFKEDEQVKEKMEKQNIIKLGMENYYKILFLSSEIVLKRMNELPLEVLYNFVVHNNDLVKNITIKKIEEEAKRRGGIGYDDEEEGIV